MPELRNKTVLILSPQAWGKMFISKHHYAIELAKRGNRVYFLNPPDQVTFSTKSSIDIKPSGAHPDLYLIDHQLFFPYRLKFRLLIVFHWLMRFHIQNLLKAIEKPIDIVWSFDLGNQYPLTFFDKHSYKIFHPVDEPLDRSAIRAARGANSMFAVTKEILQKYNQYNIPKHFINHGVSKDFLAEITDYKMNSPIRIGFSGNLLRNEIDRDILLQIINENQQCIFEFWGSYTSEQSNIGGTVDFSTKKFIETLQVNKNVILHGVVSSTELARVIKRMDAFLICYDVQRDQSRGTNYHKVMEYIATGRVIISNNITTYHDLKELVQMVEERDNNKSLPKLFRSVLDRLSDHSSQSLQKFRINFASSNTYEEQIGRIEKILYP